VQVKMMHGDSRDTRDMRGLPVRTWRPDARGREAQPRQDPLYAVAHRVRQVRTELVRCEAGESHLPAGLARLGPVRGVRFCATSPVPLNPSGDRGDVFAPIRVARIVFVHAIVFVTETRSCVIIPAAWL
jgi:hypothetical protein